MSKFVKASVVGSDGIVRSGFISSDGICDTVTMSKEHDLYLDILHNAELNNERRFSDCRSIRLMDIDEKPIRIQQYQVIDGQLVITLDK